MVEARAKAAWVNTIPAMALVEVITTTTAAATIILSMCLSPFAGTAPSRADLHGERINPRLYPANVAPVSWVSRRFGDRRNRSFTPRVELTTEGPESNRRASTLWHKSPKLLGRPEGQGTCGGNTKPSRP